MSESMRCIRRLGRPAIVAPAIVGVARELADLSEQQKGVREFSRDELRDCVLQRYPELRPVTVRNAILHLRERQLLVEPKSSKSTYDARNRGSVTLTLAPGINMMPVVSAGGEQRGFVLLGGVTRLQKERITTKLEAVALKGRGAWVREFATLGQR